MIKKIKTVPLIEIIVLLCVFTLHFFIGLVIFEIYPLFQPEEFLYSRSLKYVIEDLRDIILVNVFVVLPLMPLVFIVTHFSSNSFFVSSWVKLRTKIRYQIFFALILFAIFYYVYSVYVRKFYQLAIEGICLRNMVYWIFVLHCSPLIIPIEYYLLSKLKPVFRLICSLKIFQYIINSRLKVVSVIRNRYELNKNLQEVCSR